MTGQHNTALAAGDVVTATVAKVLPFGVLIEGPDGMPGLATGLRGAAEGQRLTVRVDDVDAAKGRFSASAG
ncbi:hypothetical protein [Arthrobacter sp. 35W]|uniref:hypothetical protein n=1 Tax=Arthrobacter sp. 35W TaxID=1132441 RepID=UPI0004161BB7|nr:hypothetical protein [Arthrobacter sp. 35W]